MRVLYDSTDPARIPADATLVAGYETGALIPTTLPALRARFPHARIATICVTAAQDGPILDVESGDATPQQVPGWVMRQRSQGRDPSVYCSTTTWPAVKTACATANVPLPWWWEAHYDGIAVLSDDPKAIAKQYTNGVTPTNAPNRVPGCDTSIVADYWPGIDPDPTQGVSDMRVIRNTDNGRCYLAGPGTVQWLETVPQLNTWLRLCGQTEPEPVTTVDLADFAHTNPREAP